MDPWKLSHLVEEHLLCFCRRLSTVKHDSFLFAYFLEQMKKLKNNLKNCACLGLYANILYILQLLTNEINLW